MKLSTLKALGFGALLAVTTFAATRTSGSWTQFRIDGSHNVVLDGSTSVTWTAVTGGPISASPIVSGTTLYIGNNRGHVDAIDVTSGRILWDRHLPNDVMSQPLLYNGALIVGEGDEQSYGSEPKTVYVGSGASAIVALDPGTGGTKWRTTVAGSAMPTGAVINGTYVEHNGAGWITALDPSNGTVRYARNLHSLASMTAALPVGNDSFVTMGVLDNAVFRLRLSDGATMWQTTFPPQGSGHGDCPPASDGNTIVCTYIMPASGAYTLPGNVAIQHIYALDLRDGKKLWDIPVEQGVLPERNEASIPLIVNGVAYLGSAIAPVMHAIDVHTGHIVWRKKVRGPVKGGVVSANGHVYFGDLRGYLWSIDPRSGNVIGTKKMRSGFNVGSPIVVGQTLIIGSRTGSLYAIPLQDIDTARDG